jgi:hypothetical protein
MRTISSHVIENNQSVKKKLCQSLCTRRGYFGALVQDHSSTHSTRLRTPQQSDAQCQYTAGKNDCPQVDQPHNRSDY